MDGGRGGKTRFIELFYQKSKENKYLTIVFKTFSISDSVSFRDLDLR
jgi:hypothetical protein